MRIPLLFTAAIVSSLSVAVAAQQQAPQPRPDPQPRATQATAGIGESTTSFVAQAVESGAKEVAAAKLALQKAASPQVKAFATRMVEDHGKANAELARIAAGQSIEISNSAGAAGEATQKLSALTGAAFDREYMEMQLVAHQEAVMLFERESEKGSNADLKAFAAKTLPTLREHLRMAQETAAAVGVEKK